MGSWGRKTNTRVCRLLEVKERFSACRKEKLSATHVTLKEDHFVKIFNGNYIVFASSVPSISKGQAGINFGHKKVIPKY